MQLIKIKELTDEIKQTWKPPERISIPDWVEANIKLPVFTAAEPGPMRISRTPYTRGVLLALGSPFIEWVVLVWGRQLGKSQGVLYPFLCYCIDQDPGPTICLLPTIDKAKYTSKNRLQPLFDNCDAINRKKTPNQDDYTNLEMHFKDMVLSMAWGGSQSQLTTRPARYLLRDEVDELKKAVGPNAIDPLKAIEEATATFYNRKIIDVSTPTSPEGNIWSELKRCQYVFEFWVPCPHCNAYQILYWKNVRFGDDLDPHVVEDSAYYECEKCHEGFNNLDKIRILGKGQWRAREDKEPHERILKGESANIIETVSLDDVLKNPYVKKIGFHLPKWYSPFTGGTFGVIAKDYLLANKAYQDGDDFVPMRNWRIYNAAIPWEEVAITETELELMKNVVQVPPLVCPKDTIALTAGIDPGQGGFWFAVYAWKRDYTCHLIHYGFLEGGYEDSGLNEILDWQYTVEAEEGKKERKLPIWRIGIDTGGSQYDEADSTMTEAAYNWLRNKKSRRLFGTKGASRSNIHRLRERKIDKMPGQKNIFIPGGLILVELNSDALKDVMWYRLRIEEERPGRLTFHSDTKSDFIKHILAEEKRLQKNGNWEWVRLRKANHWLDCTIIAIGMADSEFRGGIRVIKPQYEEVNEEEKTIQTNKITQRPTGEWINKFKRRGYVN